MELNNTNPAPSGAPQPIASPGSGALPFTPPNSPLAALWREWVEKSDLPQTRLDLTLSDPPEKVPLKSSELQLEAKKANFKLTSAANERSSLCHAPDGTLVGQADAKILIHISFNRMVAWVFVFPPINGGGDVTLEQLQTTLQEHMITEDIIDTPVLEEIASNKRYFRFFPVAHGRLPVKGKPGYVEEYFPHTAPKVEEEPKLDEDGNPIPKKPYEEDEITAPVRAGYVQNIPAGTIIAHLFPVTPGIPGTDVVGTPIPCVNGSPASLSGGPNTTLKENGDLVANIEGGLFYERNRFYVQPLYIVTKHLTLADSPVNFDGDVEILGDVKEGTEVHATGSVTVKGLVEASMITSDKDIFIDGGVLGDNRAILRAKGKIHAKYLEYCVLYAGDDVRVGDVISSQVYSNGKIEVRGGRGTVIGGCMVAPYEITAKVIGSRAECATEIRLGEFPCTALRAEEYDEQIESILAECQMLDEQIAQMEKEDSPTQKIPLTKARLRRASIEMRIDQVQKEKAGLKDKCDDYKTCKLRCDVMFPNTSIIIGPGFYTMEDKHRYITATYNSAEAQVAVRWVGND